jgi:hypothetical protein
MQGFPRPLVRPIFVVLAFVILPFAARAADDAPLTKEQIKQFLQTAEVIKNKPSSKGVTHPSRLTLSNGTMTHDASFQTIDEHKAEMKLESGKTEFDFVDSYKYNIAAYQLAELLGLDDMLPVYVERNGRAKPVRSAGGSRSRWTMPNASKRNSSLLNPISGTSRCSASAFSTS